MLSKQLFEDIENVGKPWSSDEEEKMIKALNNGKTFNEIATEHKRGIGGIKSRLKVVIKKLHDDGKTNEEIKGKIKILSIADIQNVIIHTKSSNKKQPISDNMYEEIHKIRETLQILMMIKIKKNNLNYDALLEEINNSGNSSENIEQEIQPDKVEDYFAQSEPEEKTNEIFTVSLLKKMKKYIDDKSKLKEIRKEHNISVDDFYARIKLLKSQS